MALALAVTDPPPYSSAHQARPAAIGISAIVGALWITGARAQGASILFAALGSIVAITVAAELIDGKNSEQYRGKGEAESRHASPN
jgi:hypothetical protein